MEHARQPLQATLPSRTQPEGRRLRRSPRYRVRPFGALPPRRRVSRLVPSRLRALSRLVGRDAPVIMGNEERPKLGEELTDSFCRTDPEIAAQFARVAFFSDNRADLRRVRTNALVLQCSGDAIVPDQVGKYVAAELPSGVFVRLEATGHCPNLSAPRRRTRRSRRSSPRDRRARPPRRQP